MAESRMDGGPGLIRPPRVKGHDVPLKQPGRIAAAINNAKEAWHEIRARQKAALRRLEPTRADSIASAGAARLERQTSESAKTPTTAEPPEVYDKLQDLTAQPGVPRIQDYRKPDTQK